MKPKVAFFSFSSCEGCQLQALNLEDQLLGLLGIIDIVNFREAIDEKLENYDIAFVEGSISRYSDIPDLIKIRNTAKVLVAFGSCSSQAGINAIRNRFRPEEANAMVYGDRAAWIETGHAKGIDEFVKVDYYLNGCPMDRREFIRLVKSVASGIPFITPKLPVCTECKLRGNVCIMEDRNTLCLGAVTLGGCNAICPAYGHPCVGCRGILPDANIEGMAELLRNHGATNLEIEHLYAMYNYGRVDALLSRAASR